VSAPTDVSPSLISTLPGLSYTDPALFQQEQQKIFEARWIAAVRSADLDGPGTFRTLDVGQENVILVRGRDGQLRAFLNVCRHRGARVCMERSGVARRNIQCGYHAWTYGLDGKLVAAPNLNKMPDIDRTEYGLIPVPLREWLGYAWVCVADEPPSFEDTVIGAVNDRLGGADVIEGWDIENLEVGRRISYDVAANWKLIIENFMECYHCATIHPELTEVLPEFADGFAAQYFVGHGAAFAEEAQGFTVDGSAGVSVIPGVVEVLRDHGEPAGVHQPRPGPRDLPPHVPGGAGPHGRRVRLAVPARGRAQWSGPGPFGGAVPPGQPAGLRRLRALPARRLVEGICPGRGPRAQRAPHRRVPLLGHRAAHSVNPALSLLITD
jgi:glycine betaine catabolism A